MIINILLASSAKIMIFLWFAYIFYRLRRMQLNRNTKSRMSSSGQQWEQSHLWWWFLELVSKSNEVVLNVQWYSIFCGMFIKLNLHFYRQTSSTEWVFDSDKEHTRSSKLVWVHSKRFQCFRRCWWVSRIFLRIGCNVNGSELKGRPPWNRARYVYV